MRQERRKRLHWAWLKKNPSICGDILSFVLNLNGWITLIYRMRMKLSIFTIVFLSPWTLVMGPCHFVSERIALVKLSVIGHGAFLVNGRINLGGGNVSVAEHFLYGT
jgi:hypothetical protein